METKRTKQEERLKKTYKVLVLGDLWELDHVFDGDPFHGIYRVDVVRIREIENFQEAIADPTFDVVLIDVSPYGLEVLEVVMRHPPMRPVVMVADPGHADIILAAKNKGLERYVMRLDDDQMTLDLLSCEIRSVFEQISQPPTMGYPTIDHLFRYAQYHNVSQPFFIVEMHRRLIYTNRAGARFIERLHGRRAELGDSPSAFALADDLDSFEACLEAAFEGEDVEVYHSFEALPEQERHRRIWYQPVRYDNGPVVAVSIACEDVGARRRAEETLIAREEALWSYFDMVPLPLQVLRHDLTIERANPAFQQLLGLGDHGGLADRRMLDFVHPDERDEVDQALAELFTTTKEYIQADHRYRDSEDRVVWVDQIGCAVDIGATDGPGALVVAVDVTRRKEAEQRAEQSMRMEAVGEVAGGVAHDFNNVLAVITAVGHLLRMKLSASDDEEFFEYLDKIGQAVDSGASLTHQLLNFSRTKRIEKEVVDVNEHIREVSRLLDRSMGDRVEVRLELHERSLHVALGEGQIDQIVMNLAVNARDAMPEGGALHICSRLERVGPIPPARRPGVGPGEWVVIEFRDRGVGMDLSTQRRIFEPFYTTKGPEKGTGMGLATAYRIVEGSGGKIFVDSEPGEGATFTIYLLAVDAVEAQASPKQKRARSRGATSESTARPDAPCLLLVEDEEDIREPFRIFLEGEGYRVLEAGSLAQARAVLAESGARVDLLLADVVLPDGSGVVLARELLGRIPGLKVVFMSGYAPDLLYRGEDALETKWGFLAKPISRNKLLSAVGDTLASAA